MPKKSFEELTSGEIGQLTWFDVHTHLNFLEISPEEAIENAAAVGVKRLITIGTEEPDLPVVLALAEKHYPTVSCSLGVHPHEAKQYNDRIESYIRENALKKEVVALGEMGLDFYYNQSDPDIQMEVFERQLELAADLKLPIEIHTRDAEKETYELLKKFEGRVTGILHCFTGTDWLAHKALDLGYNISLSGILTFKSAKSLQDCAKSVPLERLHIETDAPFLTPVPFRGAQNQSKFVLMTAEYLADLHGVSLAALSEQLITNAYKMFPKLPPIDS